MNIELTGIELSCIESSLFTQNTKITRTHIIVNEKNNTKRTLCGIDYTDKMYGYKYKETEYRCNCKECNRISTDINQQKERVKL
jgi:hypothetical protein